MTSPKDFPDAPTRADKRFNFACCLTDSVGWPLGAALFSQATILPAFLQHLGASNALIGALPALYNLLVFLPGLFVAGYVSHLRRARGYLFWIALVERLALLSLFPLTLLWARTHPIWLIAALFGAITVHARAMGLNQPAYWIVVGKCIPPAWRGRMFGYAGGIAGLLSFGLAPVMERLLSGPGGGFPNGYAHGFLLGAGIMLVSFFPLGLVREPPGVPRGADDPHTGHYGRDSVRIWRTQTPFRRFLYGQIALTLSSLAVPFYVLDARARLGAGSEAVAGYTALLVLAGSFGGLGAGAWSDRRGNRVVLLAACVCAALALNTKKCICMTTRTREQPAKGFQATSSSTIMSAGISRSATARLLKFISIRPYKNKSNDTNTRNTRSTKQKNQKRKASHLKKGRSTVLTMGSIILPPNHVEPLIGPVIRAPLIELHSVR